MNDESSPNGRTDPKYKKDYLLKNVSKSNKNVNTSWDNCFNFEMIGVKMTLFSYIYKVHLHPTIYLYIGFKPYGDNTLIG